MKYFYTYEEFLKDLDKLEKEIKKFNPDSLVPIARGGLTLAHFLAERLNTRNVFSINAISYENEKKFQKPKIFNIPNLEKYQKILLLDDISDSGETLNEVVKILKEKYPSKIIKSATIFYKEKTIYKPEIVLKKTNKWIVFFWDNEGQRRNNG